MQRKPKKIENEIVVISLFDGMSCAQIALAELGIKPTTYYASEIDKHAIAQTQLNFPNTIQLGSVVNVDVSKLKYVDAVFGGSPCQSFSFAGKRKGMSTKDNVEIYTLEKYLELKEQGFEFEGQSYLFWEYMRILTEIRKYNPDVKFLLENVEMGNKWERVLSEAIGVYGVHINSALVSAQNRKRIYWTNFRVKQVGLFGELHSDIPQPKDEGIFLRDILETDVDEKYYLSDAALQRAFKKSYSKPQINPQKTGTINTKNNGSSCSFDSGSTFISIDGKAPTQRCSTGRCFKKKYNYQFIKLDKQLVPKYDQLKASCFTAGANSGVNHSDMDLIACLTPKRTDYGKEIRKRYEAGEISAMRREVSQLEPRSDGKTNTLTTVQKDNLVLQINPSKESGGTQPYQQNRVYDINGIAPCLSTDSRPPNIRIQQRAHGFNKGRSYFFKSPTVLCSNDWTGNNLLHYKSRVRRLTPTEVAALQTIPKWYKWACSDTQIYKMCGNGWTIKVIMHHISFLKL